MTLTTLAVVVATLLCLAFATTRWIGVAGLALLFYLYPLLFSALLVLGGVAFFSIRYYLERKCHDIPRLPPRSD